MRFNDSVVNSEEVLPYLPTSTQATDFLMSFRISPARVTMLSISLGQCQVKSPLASEQKLSVTVRGWIELVTPRYA